MARHLAIVFLLVVLAVSVAPSRYAVADGSCAAIRVGGADLWYPYAFRDADSNEARGIAYDLIRWIGNELQVPVVFGERVPWARTEMLFDHGDLDVIAGVYNGSERWEGRGFLTIPFAEDKVSVFVKKGEEFPFSAPEDLNGRLGAALLGARWGARFERQRSKLPLQEVQKHEQVLRMILRDRVDYGVLPYFTGKYWASQLTGGDRLTALDTPISINPVHFVIARGSPCAGLLRRINGLITKARETGVLDGIVSMHTPVS